VIVLGIDPGNVTGWCVYDSEQRRAIAGGEFPEHRHDIPASVGRIDVVVQEKPVGQGVTRPEMVACGITFGRLAAWAEAKWPRAYSMPRYEVKSILGKATLGEVTVKNDSTAWAALKLIHGEGSDKKAKRNKGVEVEPPGAIGVLVGGHQKAALAVAVAWVLRERFVD